jgi:rare lipoprotein A
VASSRERPIAQGSRSSKRPTSEAVVKINDVGPLKPGRIIDLNEQTMQYFDPTMERGVIKSVKVTPLPGDDWIAGPV